MTPFLSCKDILSRRNYLPGGTYSYSVKVFTRVLCPQVFWEEYSIFTAPGPREDGGGLSQCFGQARSATVFLVKV